MENYSLSDVAAVTGRNDGFFGDGMGFFWIFALLLLPGLFNGGAWGNRNGEPVTESGLCNAINFNNLENAVGRLGDTQNAGFTGIQRDMCTATTAINAAINQARFENQQCLNRFKRAIKNLFTLKVDTVGTCAA